jgi:CDP-glycerol glycerophosphotransferase (TagB/SpsB family)
VVLSLIRRAYKISVEQGIAALVFKSLKYIFIWVEKLLALFFNLIIFRKENLIVFANSSERTEFSGNMKYFYLELSNRYDENCIWLTEYDEIKDMLSEQGYSACKTHSLRAKLYLLRAKYAVTDVDFDEKQWMYLSSATTIQLWHGYPLKNLPEKERGRLNNRIQVFDHACLNNRVEELELRNHMNMDDVHYTGYPRNDLFFREIKDSELGVNQKARKIVDGIPDDETVIGYFPTWRENNEVNPLEPDEFNSFLEEHNAHCIIKPHRYTDPFVEDSEFERIHVHPPTGDIYPLFEEIDILLTDYSSIYFDYLHLDRPIAFYPYDYERYTDTRGLNLSYQDMTPGPKSHSFGELLIDLSNLMSDDGYQEDREKVLNKVFADYGGNSSSVIYRKIIQ